MFQTTHQTRASNYFYKVQLKCPTNVLMERPAMSIFQGSEGLHLDTSVQHLEEEEADEDQKQGNKEVLQPVPCSVCVRHTCTDNI
jgi:hypothetical protein